MTESSYPWSGTSTGDAGPYSDDQWSDMYAAWFTRDRTIEGILRPSTTTGLNALAVSGVTSPVSVATGLAIVDGKFYRNTAPVDVAIPTPTSNPRIDLIVLRKSWSAQTVRIYRHAGTESASPSPPALTQTDGTTWEIPLAEVYVTTGGVITCTDVREWNRSLAGKVTDRGITINLDGSGAIIPTGLKALIPIPADMGVLNITGWSICSYPDADATGVKFDIWYESNPVSNGRPTNADSICNGNEPTLQSDSYDEADEDQILSDGWTHWLSGEGVIGINLDINNNCTLIGFTLSWEIL